MEKRKRPSLNPWQEKRDSPDKSNPLRKPPSSSVYHGGGLLAREEDIMQPFLILSKEETIRLIDLLEDMSSIFWTQAPKFSSGQVQKFCGAKNTINGILLKATAREVKP
jgi:predicted RNA-binding protein